MNELTNQARQILKAKQAGDIRKALHRGLIIYWESGDGKVKGPAMIEGVFRIEGNDWLWFTYDGQEHLLNSRMILRICDSSML